MPTVHRTESPKSRVAINVERVKELEGVGKNDEPPYLDFNLNLIFVMGLWKEKSPLGIPFLPRISLFLLYSLTTYLFLLFGSILQLLETNNLEIITETLSYFFSYAVCCHKLIHLIAYEHQFKRLMYLIKSNFLNPRQRNNANHHALLLQIDRENKLLTFFFGGFVLVCITSINFYPVTEWFFYKEPESIAGNNETSTYEWRLPYRLKMPFDTSSSFPYYAMYMYHCLLGWLHVLIMPGVDNFYVSLMNHGYGQCLCLRADLENLWKDAARVAGEQPQPPAPLAQLNADSPPLTSTSSAGTRREYRRLLKEAVQHHKTVIEYIESLEDLLNKPMLTQFFTSSVVLCTTGYQIIMFPTMLVKLMAMVAFCIGEGVQLFLYCFFANRITNESDALGTSAYFSEWYEADATDKRSLGILITRAQKKVPFTVGKFTELSLDTFASVLKGSYTYLMLMMEVK